MFICVFCHDSARLGSFLKIARKTFSWQSINYANFIYEKLLEINVTKMEYLNRSERQNTEPS